MGDVFLIAWMFAVVFAMAAEYNDFVRDFVIDAYVEDTLGLQQLRKMIKER